MQMQKNIVTEVNKTFWFDVAPDIDLARKLGCWIVLIVGARKRGKTYSMLKLGIERKEQLIFVKRNGWIFI
mgnify:CR=1 FL=1